MAKKIKQAVKKTGKARKELIVAELVEKLDASSGLVFTDYKGLTHRQLEGLKRELKKLDSTMIIAKNSLLKLSLGKSQKYADIKDNAELSQPIATLLIRGDMVEPLKKLQKLVKELGLPKVKFGVLEGNLTDAETVLKIASLPNRDVLLVQFVGMLNSPIQGLVVTLNGTIQKFVMTLDAVAKAKPAIQTPTPAPAADQVPTPIETPTPAQEETPAQTPTEEAVETTEKEVEEPEAPTVTDELADAGSEQTETLAEPAPTETPETAASEPTNSNNEVQNDNQNNEGGEQK